ncbi:MAG: Maf family protein [Bacteroidales bacterium]
MLKNLKDRNIILGSRSPRRRYLLEQLGLSFTVMSAEMEENIPEGLDPEKAAILIAEMKSAHFRELLDNPENIVITADTLVVIDGQILGKPKDPDEGRQMLRALSGRVHEVMTGVCIRDSQKSRSFTASTHVWFKSLSDAEIVYYLENYKPYDKAGAYGIQEWIGYIGITRIEGSYFNVMGLPVQRLYEELLKF